MIQTEKKLLSLLQSRDLLTMLKARFEKNMHRHPGVLWPDVEDRLANDFAKQWPLNEMERTGGEPDVVSINNKNKQIFFIDCAAESPKGRRSICYDGKALEERKENKPQGSAMAMAAAMGIEVLTEDIYRKLQAVESFDTKTSSWVKTPEVVRKLGGALFCDRRYNTVFLYHNGADSYYAARGFRGYLTV